VRKFGPHTVLFSEGDPSDALYVLLSGRVKVFGADEDGREVIFNIHGPGEWFGEVALDGGPRSASVMTLESCRVVVIPGAEARALLVEHPQFPAQLVKKLGALLRHSTRSVKSLALQDVYGRLRDTLRSMTGSESGIGQIEPKPTQQELAERVGSSREMVSRIFATLVRGGYVESAGSRLVVLKKLPERW
jgi:CRP/FNR family cyclic AMP-dependent transcriptional regulator